MPAPGYILALLFTVCFTLTTWLQPLAANRNITREQSQNLLGVMMGDAQRLFAGLMFRKADVYFHSGYYPSIFDQGRTNQMHIAEQAGPDQPGGQGDAHGDDNEGEAGHEGHDHPAHGAHEEEGMDFMKPPLDWIEALGRHAINTEHTHLDENGKVAEMLPWLKMSAELDPQRVDTYTVASFWLRGPMKHPKVAEEFLREGQRANPDSYEILFELARLYRDSLGDPDRARNLFLLALRKLDKQEKQSGQPDLLGKREILISLSRLEEKAGHIPESIRYLQLLLPAVPQDDEKTRHELEDQIKDLSGRLNK